MRNTRYYPGYGYVTHRDTIYGDGIWEVISGLVSKAPKLINTVSSNIPAQLKDVGKDALMGIGKSAIKAGGDKIGRKIADKIIGKPEEVLKETPKDEQEIRRQVLKELQLLPPSLEKLSLHKEKPVNTYFGEGIKIF